MILRNIKVINHQTIDRETDIIEEKGIGSYREKNGKYYIVYDVNSEENSSHVTVIVDGSIVKIKRSGETAASEMVYDTERDTVFKYNTPYGSINMEIKTIRIHNGLTQDGGVLKIVYTLVMQGMSTYNDTEIIIE